MGGYLRKLEVKEIEKFASRRCVNRVAVENFLMTVENSETLNGALANLVMDAKRYNWNNDTILAIADGIAESAGVPDCGSSVILKKHEITVDVGGSTITVNR